MSLNPIPDKVVPVSTLVTILAVALLALGTMISIVVVNVLLPGRDETELYRTIAIIVVPTVAALLSYLKSAQVVEQVKGVHVDLNSRLSEWFKQTEAEKQTAVATAKAQGIVEGHAAAIVGAVPPGILGIVPPATPDMTPSPSLPPASEADGIK